MIRVVVCKGVPYIWDPADCRKLQCELRILGSFDGAEGYRWTLPLDQEYFSLPLRLSFVETQYLIKMGLGETVEVPILSQLKPKVTVAEFQELRNRRRLEQIELHKHQRRNDMTLMADKILEGKRKKGGPVPDIDALIEEEVNKVDTTAGGLPLEYIQIDWQDPWVTSQDYVPFNFPMPQTEVEQVRLRVFEDFHGKRKYYLTNGTKFGGDFLAYPGHPNNYHAEFIIMCNESSRPFSKQHLMSQCRIAQSVRKTLLVASLKAPDRLMYKPIVSPFNDIVFNDGYSQQQ